MITAELEDPKQQESLALEIACGRSIRAWARRNGVDAALAYESSLTNEFRALVDLARLRVADSVVGKLLKGVKLAIAQLIRLCTRSTSESIRLSASRALLNHWVEIAENFDLMGRVRAIEAQNAKVHNGMRPGQWRPANPWKK